MKLMFSAAEIPERQRGLTFDDVLLVPNHSEISSRRTPDLSTQATKNFRINLPLISSNMDTITEKEMALAMAKAGALGILHRFMSLEDQLLQVRELHREQNALGLKTPIAASIGVKEDGKARAQALVEAGVQILTIDIAHGDSVMMMETLEYVKTKFPHIQVIAGNVATAQGVRRLIDNGADAVKVGIGPGSMCTTRIITGCGMPQLTSIALCAIEAHRSSVPVIADGGLKNSGDIMKALAAGADSVMLGSMLSGALETPGEVKSGMKVYRGMASKDAQVSWRGELPKGMAAEGVATIIPCKGPVEYLVEEMSGGIRSGMTYINALNIEQIAQRALFMEMSFSGMVESRPHGLK